jgi:dTDP-4-amino-4,6-dideoxygalactose transaminase
MLSLMRLADSSGIAVVEDAAQAHAASVADRFVGSFGTGVFSFYATKNVTTAEGGIVTTNDDALADRLRLLRSQGMRTRYEYELPGYNYRMTELQAALGVAELERLDDYTEKRRANAAVLREGLATMNGIALPATSPDRKHVYHQFTVRVTPRCRVSRDELASALLELGVETGVYYPKPVYAYPCYQSHPGVQLSSAPEAERAAQQVLSLPVHPWLRPDDLQHIISAVRSVVGER